MNFDDGLDDFREWLKDNGKYNLVSFDDIVSQFRIYQQEKHPEQDLSKLSDRDISLRMGLFQAKKQNDDFGADKLDNFPKISR